MCAKPLTRSGRFVVRISPLLHQELCKKAKMMNTSLNEVCQLALQKQITPVSESSDGMRPLVEAIIQEFGNGCLGILLFGSAVRNELMADSDIDLLIVTRQPIDRSLYRRWDGSSLIASATAEFPVTVNPQFVSWPLAPDLVGGIWLECALEGRIIWDPQFQLHQVLVQIRNSIVEGHFVRSVSHGHPYWTKKKVG